MPDISFKMHPGLIAVLCDFISNCANSLIEGGFAQQVAIPEDDADLQEAWFQELRQALSRDCDTILRLIRDPNFGKGTVKMKDYEAENIMRACSAVRLRLRDTALASISDESLENGEIETGSEDMTIQRALAAYIFLAHLQDSLIQALDGRGGYA